MHTCKQRVTAAAWGLKRKKLCGLGWQIVVGAICVAGLPTALVDIHVELSISIGLVDSEQSDFRTVRVARARREMWLD